MSLFSPSASPLPSIKKLPRNTHTYTKSATAAATSSRSRRVYGKREADAPRAVLEREHNNASSKAPAIPNEGQEVQVENMITALGKGLSALQLDVNEPTIDVGRDEEDVATTEQSDALVENEAQRREQPMVEIRIPTYKGVQQEGVVTHERDASSSRSPEAVKSKRRPRRSSGWIEDLKLNNYVRPILKEATSPISSRGVQSFASWARRAGDMFTVEKIAEGSYGEVYQLRLSRDISKCNLSKSRLARLKAYKDGVLKIIPLRAQRGVGSKKFTAVQEIVSEVQLLKLLDPIPGFARFREVHVVQGRFPDTYQQAWTRYSQTNASECFNPDPSKVKSYPDTQLWAVLEMDNAGCELEKFAWSSAFQVYDIFWGVALALARAEQFAAFEHRDLHLGNICIKPTKKGGIMSMDLSTSTLEGFGGGGRGTTGFGLSGLETTIIDYSLSRAELQALDTPDGDVEAEAEAGAKGENPTVEIAWSDLDKRQIFGAIGRDEDETLLRDTYRFMRSEVYHQENLLCPTQPPSKPRQWKHYNPRTNLIWLSFLLRMLLKKLDPSCQYQGQTAEQLQQKQQQRAPLTPRPANHKLNSNTVPHGDGDSPFKSPKKKTVQVKRGGGGRNEEDGKQSDAVLINKKHFAQLQQQQLLKEELAMRLQTTAEMLSVESGIEDLYCAGDLVAFALGSGWLGEGDFLG
ncbi:hypothetical protein EMPG_13350 [Blastomyces silverae]|uniref:non-specific serine/threonine protein kinase n=1 Tax=Blastomyces silverae TaxID=2060906 RepID=A0A0H1BQL8_9EURO|nr:hypothetical protein EMPG_13350 [Blastomyces silverae]